MHTECKINISIHYYNLCCITNHLHMNKIPDSLLSDLIMYAPARPWLPQGLVTNYREGGGATNGKGRACEVLPLRKQKGGRKSF